MRTGFHMEENTMGHLSENYVWHYPLWDTTIVANHAISFMRI
jgi:hypothetical protein